MNYKKISTKREKEIAKDISGQRHVGSGNVWFKRGDASNEFLLIEDKFVISDRYSIKLDIIDKLTSQAHKQGKLPILRFGFSNRSIFQNYACIESCYCNQEAEVGSIMFYTSSKKSKTIKYNDLYAALTTFQGDPIVLKLVFYEERRTFYIIEWQDFLKSQENLIVSF